MMTLPEPPAAPLKLPFWLFDPAAPPPPPPLFAVPADMLELELPDPPLPPPPFPPRLPLYQLP